MARTFGSNGDKKKNEEHKESTYQLYISVENSKRHVGTNVEKNSLSTGLK